MRKPDKNNFQSLVVTCVWITALFSGLIAVSMLVFSLRGGTTSVLDSEPLMQMKQQLLQEPSNTAFQDDIRTLDLQLRQRFFRQQRLVESGRYLLFTAIVLCLIFLKILSDLNKKPPHPKPGEDPEGELTSLRQRAFVLLLCLGGALLLGGYLLMGRQGTSSSMNLGHLLVQHQAGMTEAAQQAATAAQAKEEAWPSYPSYDEIQKQWPRFRGPGGLGISPYDNIPVRWDGKSGENILWKTAIPLPGNNSPVVWNNSIFLTGADEETRKVYCFALDTGKLLWEGDVGIIPGSPGEEPEIMEETGYAASTAATDGRQVYAIFANGDVAAFNFAGKRQWARSLGLPESIYGYATSLCMYRDNLLVQFDQSYEEAGKSKLICIDARSGKIQWEVKRPVANSWATPIIINSETRPELITCAAPFTIAYNPQNGKEIWRAENLYGDVAPSPVISHNMVFTIKPSEEMAAIKLENAEGNITDTHIAWKTAANIPETASPLATEKHIYQTCYGTLTAYDVMTGEVVWEEDTGFEFNASPSLAGGLIYLFSVDGVAILIKADQAYEMAQRNELGEGVNASPAFAGGRIIVRGKKHLYCIGEE